MDDAPFPIWAELRKFCPITHICPTRYKGHTQNRLWSNEVLVMPFASACDTPGHRIRVTIHQLESTAHSTGEDGVSDASPIISKREDPKCAYLQRPDRFIRQEAIEMNTF